MKTIILPGYSAHNREWAEEVAADLEGAEVHPWAHWESGGTFDALQELAAILKRVDRSQSNLLAKSIGCRMAARVVSQKPDRINKVIFCGFPRSNIEAQADFKTSLENLAEDRILVVQNQADPYAPYDEILQMVEGIDSRVRVVEGERDDHHYPYPALFKEFFEV